MTDFSDDWLALRAAADSRARADGLLAPLRADWPAPRQVLDLGAGTGANLHHLAPELGPDQQWTCADHDVALLARLPPRMREWAAAAGHGCDGENGILRCRGHGWSCRVTTQQLDLSADLHRLDMPAGGLVTASALLDLVSEDWLEHLLQRAAGAGCRLLFALNYDGRTALTPPLAADTGSETPVAEMADADIIALVNAHQRSDKGFGPALGPAAAETAAALARRLGYRVTTARSDWQIGPDEPALQRALLDGWTQAAVEIDPTAAAAIHAWRQLREDEIRAGRLGILVGHVDVVASG